MTPQVSPIDFVWDFYGKPSHEWLHKRQTDFNRLNSSKLVTWDQKVSEGNPLKNKTTWNNRKTYCANYPQFSISVLTEMKDCLMKCFVKGRIYEGGCPLEGFHKGTVTREGIGRWQGVQGGSGTSRLGHETSDNIRSRTVLINVS